MWSWGRLGVCGFSWVSKWWHLHQIEAPIRISGKGMLRNVRYNCYTLFLNRLGHPILMKIPIWRRNLLVLNLLAVSGIEKGRYLLVMASIFIMRTCYRIITRSHSSNSACSLLTLGNSAMTVISFGWWGRIKSMLCIVSSLQDAHEQIGTAISTALKASHLFPIFLGSSERGPSRQSSSIQSNLMLEMQEGPQ